MLRLSLFFAEDDVLNLLDTFWHFARGEAALCEGVQRGACGAEVAIDKYFVHKTALECAFVDKLCFYIDDIAEFAGTLVLYAQFQNGACKAFFFDFGVGGAYRLEKINTGLFKPNGVGGVVDNAHGVCFCIADFDMRRESEILLFHAPNLATSREYASAHLYVFMIMVLGKINWTPKTRPGFTLLYNSGCQNGVRMVSKSACWKRF